ncbi:TetR family transcriptional regulator [Streptomyces sp. NPDC049954]|uniref:TetR/AcrR family transcriptional regulator n=1 Tax=Streptomyces sp. NPDC049954 TaxID=3155779 RepID=UPI003414ECA4
MGRAKEFDPEAALGTAMELFWERGYEATTMAHLVAALGIGRASLYATFGGKRELYLRALDRYGACHDPRLLDELSAPGPALPGVREVVLRFADEAARATTRGRGCFVTNTAAELGARDPEAAFRVERGWAHIETLLHSALLRARAQGELAPERDPAALARLLLVLLQGMRVVGKVSADPARVRDAAREALTLLG